MPRLSIPDALTDDPPPPDWLVPEFFHKGSMVILAGDAGIGKSFLSYHLALAVASGTMFLGTPVALARVLYIEEENSLRDVQTYLRWNWVGMGKPDPLTISEHLRVEHFSLSAPSPGHYHEMVGLAIEHKPALIIIDTATPTCRIADENSNGEASAAIRWLRAVKAAAGPETVMVVLKHARVDSESGERDIRGAKAWRGEADGVIFHFAQPGRPRDDGLRVTHLEPRKTRAYGLRERVTISPSWVMPNKTGITLERLPK